MSDFILKFPEDIYLADDPELKPHDLDLASLMTYLFKYSREIQISSNFDDNRWFYHEIRVKSSRVSLKEVIRCMPEPHQSNLVEFREVSLCQDYNCFQVIAEDYFIGELNIMLFDRDGEEPHELHTHCKFHVHASTRQLANTLEVVDIFVYGPDSWERIATWKKRRNYYAQKVIQYMDGDYESGYLPCCEGTPQLGPFNNRETAIAAAKSHK